MAPYLIPGLDHTETYGYEELSRCIAIGNIQKINVMLTIQGADVNATDDFGYTLLMKAVQFGKLEIVKLLLEHGAHVNTVNQAGLTAMQYATRSNRRDIEEVLLSAGAK